MPNVVKIIVDGTTLTQAEAYGDFPTHPRGYYEVRGAWQNLGASGSLWSVVPWLFSRMSTNRFREDIIAYNTNRIVRHLCGSQNTNYGYYDGNCLRSWLE